MCKMVDISASEVSEVIAIPIIMQTRLSNPKTIKFRSDLGFNQIKLVLKKNNQL